MHERTMNVTSIYCLEILFLQATLDAEIIFFVPEFHLDKF